MIGISFENEIRDYIDLLYVDETGCMARTICYNTECWEDTTKGGNSWTIGNMIIWETRLSYYQIR